MAKQVGGYLVGGLLVLLSTLVASAQEAPLSPDEAEFRERVLAYNTRLDEWMNEILPEDAEISRTPTGNLGSEFVSWMIPADHPDADRVLAEWQTFLDADRLSAVNSTHEAACDVDSAHAWIDQSMVVSADPVLGAAMSGSAAIKPIEPDRPRVTEATATAWLNCDVGTEAGVGFVTTALGSGFAGAHQVNPFQEARSSSIVRTFAPQPEDVSGGTRRPQLARTGTLSSCESTGVPASRM